MAGEGLCEDMGMRSERRKGTGRVGSQGSANRLPEAEIRLGDSRTESRLSSEAAESKGRVRRKRRGRGQGLCRQCRHQAVVSLDFCLRSKDGQ